MIASKYVCQLLCGALGLLLAGCGTLPTSTGELVMASPDGRVQVSLTMADGLRYGVTVDRQTLLVASQLGLELRGELVLGAAVEMLDAQRRSVDAVWENVPGGKRRLVLDHANELMLHLRERGGPKFAVIFRAYNDGVAFRYVLPRTGELTSFVLEREMTGFTFAEDHPAYFGRHVKPSFRGAQEWEYQPGKLGDIKSSDLIGCPVLVQTPAAWVALTEAGLVDWAGMWLAGAPTNSGRGVSLIARLAPRLDGEGLVSGELPHQSPWRVIMVGRQPGDLMESDLVANLASPAQPGDWSWVKPGLMAWDGWWAYGNATSNPGTDTAAIEKYIQLAADMGWPYMLVDWWWYGEPNTPQSDLRHLNPKVDMPRVLKFAADRSVRLWLWVRWNDLERFEPADRFFARCEAWGIAGVKIDFMDRDDQEMVQWYERIAATAAKHKLMVNFHGAMKPTGMNRTWPNQVTREGILGSEYNKWSTRVTPEHRATLPFTRFLCGPGDFTPGGFLNRQPEAFRKNSKPAQVQGTRAAELALFVVYDSPLQCVCDHPDNIRGQPGADFLKLVPTVWEETRVLDARVADYLVMARRAADDRWYIGGITDGAAREVEVKLDFLGAGDWTLQLWRDTPASDVDAEEMVSESSKVDAGRTLKIRLSPAGGFAGRLSRE